MDDPLHEIPTDFRTISEHRFRHRFRYGDYKNYSWLQSNLCIANEFIEHMRSVRGPYRILLIETEDGQLDDANKQEWERFAGFMLSPVVENLPSSLCVSRNGLALVKSESQDSRTFSPENLATLDRIDRLEPDDLELPDVVNFWSSLAAIGAMTFVFEAERTTIASTERALIPSFTQSSSFLSASNRLRDRLVKSRIDRLLGLGRELGPEKCVEPDCAKLRIALAVRCVEHHIIFGANQRSLLGPECGPEKCIEDGCESLRIQVSLRCIRHQVLQEW